jgi:ABC-2 type transport system permease protein
VYFVIAYFTIASMMAAIGSAVSELREAQTLMTPVMTLMIIPWVLWLPISRAPNSLLAQILSFVPGPNPFVMVIRLCGSEPVPFWQIPASLAVGAAGAVFAAWSAAKIFRIGALMYGKPPNFRTLIKWVRMA